MSSPRERIRQFGGRLPKGAIPLTDGRIDFSKDLTMMAALTAHHPLPPVPENANEPYVGITTDGTAIPGLYELADELDTRSLVDAAQAFVRTLSDAQRTVALWPIDAAEWRMWSNAFPAWEPHGICLQYSTDTQRGSAMELVNLSLSEAGY